ncbi:hypothetical protein [Streptomyces sp. 7N604]|uniref:hypothetical protein n=1 Tax=Streptomyces sp. 7N604 TaxID=3457415 RepID=UPI003FCF5177
MPGRSGAWLKEALATIGAATLDHRGNHRYACLIGPRRELRHFTITTYPYPKKHQPGPGDE